MKPNTQAFGLLVQNLKRLRTAKDLTQQQLAAASDIRPIKRYIAIEEGKTNLCFVSLVKLAMALEVKVEDLFQEPEI